MYAADDSDDDTGHPGCVDELDPPEPHAATRGSTFRAFQECVGCRPPTESANLAPAQRALTRCPAPSIIPPDRWGADPRLLQYRVAPPPRDDPTAIRGTLPAFGSARRRDRTADASEKKRENRNDVGSAGADAKTSSPRTSPSTSAPSEPDANDPRDPMYPMRLSHTTQHNAHSLGNPALAMAALPEHTKRLLFAQAMLNNQRALNDECARLIGARREALLKRRAAQRQEALEARAREDDLARRAAEVDKTLGDAELAMNAKRGFRNVARHLSSMLNLSLSTETERRSEKPTFAQARREAQANALATARKDANGYVDLRPEPPLPPVPALLSLEKNPVVPDEKHVYALKKRKPGEASQVREAVLAAAAVAGDAAVAAWRSARTARDDIEAFARAYDDDEFRVSASSESEEEDATSAMTETRPETRVRYCRRKPHSRWEGVRDDESARDEEDDARDVRKRERDRLEAAAETHAARLQKDAEQASSAGKFTKAEHHLRQLVALRVAGGGGPRAYGVGEKKRNETRAADAAADFLGADERQSRNAPRASVDPVGAARALVLLARAVRAQRDQRRLEEVAALFARAAAAVTAANGDDDAGVAADSDAEASTRLAALDGLSAASAALDSARGDEDALWYARRALAYAEKRFGPWDPRVARGARIAAARWLRVGDGGDGDGQRELPGSSSGGGGEAESAGVATATAIDLLRDALEVTEKALGKNHAMAIETMCELAAAHKRAGDFPRARRLDEERRARRRTGNTVAEARARGDEREESSFV